MIVAAATSDPSWFYSSLAQSSAAVVGFVGAFLIFRIQDYMAAWARMASELQTLQGRWSVAATQVRSQENAWLRAVRSGEVEGTQQDHKQFVDSALERQEDEAWRDLRPLLDRRRTEEFPRELVMSAALLGALFLVGTLAPLMFLSSPSNLAQVLWVVLVGAAVAVVAGAMLYRAKQEYDRFKNQLLFSSVLGEYEVALLQEEAWEEQDRWEREERARLVQERLEQEAEVQREDEAEEARRDADPPAD